MSEKSIQKIYNNFLKDLKILSPSELKVKYLGRKGALTLILRSLANLPLSERKKLGKQANELRVVMERMIKAQSEKLTQKNLSFDWQGSVGRLWQKQNGILHPLTYLQRKLIKPFLDLGFQVEDGPEVEFASYNFDRLNFPKEHPARDMQDTFYLAVESYKEEQPLLRTHTSSVQIRAMEKYRPPVYLVVPGRVYRNEATDASHSCYLYQLECLVIDKNIALTSLLWVLEFFAKEVFGPKTKIRVRPSYFPFVEPGLEVDFSCLICGGSGIFKKSSCSVCKGRGWLEIGGAGMVHPRVLEEMKVDTEIYSGFAFGLGVDRMVMLYYSIPDIRLLYENDIRFIKQFS